MADGVAKAADLVSKADKKLKGTPQTALHIKDALTRVWFAGYSFFGNKHEEGKLQKACKQLQRMH